MLFIKIPGTIFIAINKRFYVNESLTYISSAIHIDLLYAKSVNHLHQL